MSDERYEISTDKWGDPTINGRRAIEWSDTAMVDAIRQQSRDIEQLRAELNRERETNAGLRRDLADPPPDIQELALKKCGHFEIVAKLRADLAAAVAERDSLAIERDQARLTLREIAQIIIEQIGSAGPENAINAALRACEAIESMATRLAAIDAAPTIALTFCHPYSHEEPGQLIARPAKD